MDEQKYSEIIKTLEETAKPTYKVIPNSGPSYLLRDGRFLYLDKINTQSYPMHSDEKSYLIIDCGFNKEDVNEALAKYLYGAMANNDGGLRAWETVIRINKDIKPTEAQYKSLKDWIEEIIYNPKDRDHISVTVNTYDESKPNHKLWTDTYHSYKLQEYDKHIQDYVVLEADYIIDRIKKFYSIGKLLESKSEHSFEEIKKAIIDSGYFPVGEIDETGFILPDGDFLNTADNTYGIYWHNTVEAFLQEIDMHDEEAEWVSSQNDSGDGSPTLERFGAIRVSSGECYICLPPVRPSEAAFDTLNRWLDNYIKVWGWADHVPPIYVTNYSGNKDNSYEATDDIVKKIKRYYSSGKLVEEIDPNNKQKLYNFLKNEIGLSKQPNMEGASYILEDGLFVQINDGPWKDEYPDDDKYDTHDAFNYYLEDKLPNIPHDYFMVEEYLSPIRINNQESYIALSKNNKPTSAQLSALANWYDDYCEWARRNSKDLLLGDPNTLQVVWGLEHEGNRIDQAGINIINHDSKDLIKMINEFYRTGRIISGYEFLEEASSMIVYHGTDIPNITKFDHAQNWFSPSWNYANYYAVSLNNTGYIYKCEIKLGKNLNVGRTGYPVYSPIPIQPYILTKEIKKIFQQLGIEDEKEIRPLLDKVAKEFNLKYNGYQMKLSTVIRSKVFIELLKEKGYDSISAIEYCVPTKEYVNTYGILNPSLIRILDKEEVQYQRPQPINDSYLEEKIITTEKFDMLYTTSPYEVKDKLFASKDAMRVFIDATHNKVSEDVYLVGNAYGCTHTDMLDALWNTDYIDLEWNDNNGSQIAIVYVPDEASRSFTASDAVDDDYDTMYTYSDFVIYSRYSSFRKFQLYRVLGKPLKTTPINKDYIYKLYTGSLEEDIEEKEITPEQEKELLKHLMRFFGNNTKEYIGDACYLTPNGTYINLGEYHENGDNEIEFFCSEHGLDRFDDYEKRLGLIHCGSFYYNYIIISTPPTKQQIEALKSFEDYNLDKHNDIEINCGNTRIKLMFDEDTFSYVDKNGIKTSITKELKKYYGV